MHTGKLIRNASLGVLALALAAPQLVLAHGYGPDASAPAGLAAIASDQAAGADGAGQAEDGGETKIPTMSFGEWGVDPALIDPAIDPGDDFFAYVNARWLADNPLPPQFSRFGAFNLLREKSTADVKAVMDELLAKDPAARSHDEQRIVNVYNAYLDTAAIDARGLAPARPYVDAIFSAASLDDLALLWATPGYPAPFGGYVSVDAKQPDRYIAYVGISGLGLPDRDYYLDDSEKGREIQEKYKQYMSFLFEQVGYEDPRAAAEAVYALEETMAREVIWPRTLRRNAELTYNPLEIGQLEALSGKFPVRAVLDRTGLAASPHFVVDQLPPSPERARELGLSEEEIARIGKGLPGMMEMLGDAPLATLQAWTVKQFLSNHADVLPSRFDEARFAFYGRTLQGTPEQRERWKRAIDASEEALGELLGRFYVERYFPPENKAAMEELVANLRIALAESIRENDWMSAPTKEQALAKLESFDPKIGYRENLETYEGLEVSGDDPLGNAIAAQAWHLADNVAKLGQPIDRTEWFMLPQTVNAYYNPTKNEIVFPAAILQQPFFGMNADIAVNYGAIGGVIGHEMGHGFDDQGSKFDGTGMLRNWWTDADRAAFDKLGAALVAQYSAYCPLDDGKTCVNGKLTLGENIGDLGGLSLAYRAFKLATKDKQLPVLDGFTADQRFFLAWAQVWRSAQREDNYRQRLRTDPHSPEEYRVNGVVRNLDAWYEAFGVDKDDALYLPPEQRVVIW